MTRRATQLDGGHWCYCVLEIACEEHGVRQLQFAQCKLIRHIMSSTDELGLGVLTVV